jgi:NADH:ubiquinone oxidoreductase subunit 5 (subunit L)/multisubunit Na+/H+ antiporter MnhA subunit
MFIALLINPFLTLYHIIIHALFKSFLFLLCGSAIHVQHNHQSTFKLKIKHTLIKTLFLASGCAMVLAISKESIIQSSALASSSLFFLSFVLIGSAATILYTFNIFAECLYYSFTGLGPCIYNSFLVVALIISTIAIDIALEHTIDSALFCAFDNMTYFASPSHFSCCILACPLVIQLYIWNPTNHRPCFRSCVYLF